MEYNNNKNNNIKIPLLSTLHCERIIFFSYTLLLPTITTCMTQIIKQKLNLKNLINK